MILFGFSDVYSNMSDIVSTIHIHTIVLNGGDTNIQFFQNMDTDVNMDLIIYICLHPHYTSWDTPKLLVFASVLFVICIFHLEFNFETPGDADNCSRAQTMKIFSNNTPAIWIITIAFGERLLLPNH